MDTSMKNTDTIDIKYSRDVEADEACITLVLNGVEVEGTFNDFVFASSKELKVGTIELLTCLCGVSGCAGIFYGTKIKRRRYTTEWRDIDCGFPKKFYRFDNAEYDAAIDATLSALRDVAISREKAGKVWEDYDYGSFYRFHSVAELEQRLERNKRRLFNS